VPRANGKGSMDNIPARHCPSRQRAARGEPLTPAIKLLN
jgi:hypothetical protein